MKIRLLRKLHKVYVRLFHPQYCPKCGLELAEMVEPYTFNAISGAISSFIFDLYCPRKHVWYSYTEPAPKHYVITKAEWDNMDVN